MWKRQVEKESMMVGYSKKLLADQSEVVVLITLSLAEGES